MAPDNQSNLGSAGRRQVTALCYDLVGSTRLARLLDPEDLHDLQRSFHKACAYAVTSYGGYVDSYAGDGAMAFFGYPVAHEDSTERAVQAALEILAARERLNADLLLREWGGEIAVRVGVATGLVVVGGESGAGGRDVVGFAVNLAFKLQGVAAPNTIVISASTHVLVAGLFECRPGPTLALESLSEPEQGWVVARALRTPTRFEAVRSHKLIPLVSRQREMETLERAWADAKAGRGRAVLISGEAGIGKSRLALTAKRTLVEHSHARLTFQCSSQRTDTALHPVTAEIERLLALGPRQREEKVVHHRLARLVAPVVPDPSRVVPLLAHLLSLSGASIPVNLAGVSPQLLKERTLGALLDIVEALSCRRPTLIVVEDAHWIDPTSRELLDRLVASLPRLPVLLLVTARPGFAPPAWRTAEGCTFLPLHRLTRRQCVTLIRRLAGGRPLPPEVVERIVAVGGGVPLFIEELSRAALEAHGERSGGETSAAVAIEIPASLSDLLTARLDQLGAAKAVVQVGSVIGRSFPVDLARQAAAADETLTEDALDRLVQLGLATVQGRSRERVCTFRHVLIQEAAYQTMLRSVRRAVHRRVAGLLEEVYRNTRVATAEVLAYHYAEAGEVPAAILNYHKAGRLAAARSANREATRLLGRALELLRTLRPSRERDQQELALLVSLGPVMITTSGPGASEVRRLYDQAVLLCRQLPESSFQFPAYWGWWRVSPDFKVMHDRAHVLATLARTLNNEQLLLQAHHCQWATLFMLGKQEACCAHIAEGLRLYEEGDYRAHGTLYGGHDPKGCALGERALSLWLQGLPDASLEAIAQCLAHTRALGHAGSIAHAKDQEIMVRRYRREAALVLELARSMRNFAAEQRFPDLGAKADVFEGWALATLSQARAGVELIERGLTTQREIGTQEDFPVYFEILAEAQRLAGRPERGLPMIEEAVAMAERTGLQYWTAELLRQKGELLRAVGAEPSAALAWLERADEIARGQRVRSLQLRTAMSKARLLAAVGRREEARACLAPVHATFGEGFDTLDLQDAARLLEELR